MEDLGVTASVSMSTENVERAFDRVGDKAAQMANKVAKEAEKAGAATDNMGAGAEKSAEKFTRAESRMRTAIQKSTRELEMLGKTASQKFEAQLDFKGLDKAKFQPFLDELRKAEEATKKAESGLSGLGSAAQAAGRAMAVAFSGAAAFGVVGKLVEVQREFDVLNSSLKTVTGSSAAAERELSWLKTFAKETPFGLAQATQGFVKMKALGLDPTRAALTSFGNTASAMGTDLNQMIEAVADASTGEFERLKEFGIKAKKEGDNVSLTFQGVTTTIKNSASEITKYLEDIGNVQFGGAMAERAKTLDGAISELGDTWDELFRTLNERNAGTLIYDSIKLANGAIEDATTIIKAMTAAYDESGQATGAMATIQNGIATVFETVAVLGANLKYVLVQIGAEIGGLAAQVAQAAQFNFAGVAAIREQMVADAEEARKQIDLTEKRILGARKAQEEYARYATRNASAATDPRRVDLGTSSAPTVATRAGARATKEALSEYDKLMQRLGVDLPKAAAAAEAAQHGYNKSQEEFIALAGSPVWAGFTSQQRAQVAALFENRIASEQAADAAKTLAKANLDAAASREKYLTSLSTGLDKIKADTAAQLESTARLGLSKEAIAELDAAKLEMLATDLELQAIKAMDRNLDEQTYNALKQQAEAYRELAAAKKAGATKEMALDLEKANREAAKKAADEWERAADQINQSLTDALMRGFESGKDFAKNLRDTVVNMFKTMVLRPVVSAVLSPISGALTGALGLSGAANAATGGAGGANILSTVQTGFSALNGSISSTIGNAFSKFAGSSVGQSLGLSNAQAIAGNNPSAYVPAGGQLTGTGQALGSALGVVGDTLAGYAMGSMARSLISGGYSVSKGMDTFQKVGVAVGSALGGPIGGAVIGAAAGVVNRLFGRKLKDSGIQGTFGGQTGFEGESFEFYKGGLFRSDKTKTNPLDEEVRKTLGDAFNAMRVEVGTFATLLGQETSRLATFTSSLKISTKGLDDKAAQEKIQEALATANNELAEQVIGSWQQTVETISRTISTGNNTETGNGLVETQFDEVITKTSYTASEFARDGEKAIDTLRRLATSLSTVNGVWDQLGNTLLDASLSGGNAASKIADAFGGIDALVSASGEYFQNFYSAEERRQKLRSQLEKKFQDLGLSLPDIDSQTAREQFRALAQAQDLTTDSGVKTYAALLQLSGAFASVTSAVEAASQTANQAAEQAAQMAERPAAEQASIASDLRRQILELTGDTAAIRQLEIAGMNAANVALYDRVQALQAEAQQNAIRADLERQVLELTGDTAAIRQLEIAGMDAVNVALYDRIQALQSEQQAQAEAQRAAEQAAQAQIELQRRTAEAMQQLQIELYRAQGDNLSAVAMERERELAALAQFGPAAVAMQQQIYGLIDAMAASNAAAASYFAGIDRIAAEQGYNDQAQSAIDALFGAVGSGAASASQAAADAAKSAAASWRSAASSIQSSLEKLRASTTSLSDPASRYAETKSVLDEYTRLALGGDASAAEKLAGAADAFLSASEGGTMTQAEYLRDRVLTEAKLASVMESSEAQASLQESIASSASAAVSELQALNSNLTGFAGDLYDLLRNSYSDVGRDGATGIAATFAKMQADFEAYFSDNTRFAVGSKYSDPSFGGASFTKLDNNMAQFTGADGVVSYLRAGESLLDVAKRIPELRKLWEQSYNVSLPAFAVGTNYVPRDMTARIHEGEAIVPKAFNPWANGGGSTGADNAEVVAELRAVTAQLVKLEARLAEIEKTNDQMAQQQDNGTDGGNAYRAEIMNVAALAQAIKEATA